ncbi:MAG: hypothetical protein N3D75_01230 [Candidatus Aenigmarchaeota archaeon]|nr:hypothetical protein [Candidatus Aenigmarchaeota archaeon]
MEGDVALFPKLKQKLNEIGFKLQSSNRDEVIWGFDGVTKYYPEEMYIRDSENGKPKVSLKLRRTMNGITVILNTVPFKEQFHLDRAPLTEDEAIDIIQKYINLL